MTRQGVPVFGGAAVRRPWSGRLAQAIGLIALWRRRHRERGYLCEVERGVALELLAQGHEAGREAGKPFWAA